MHLDNKTLTLIHSLLLTKSAYNRRVYAISARQFHKLAELWRTPGKQALAIRMELRANNFLRNAMEKSMSRRK